MKYFLCFFALCLSFQSCSVDSSVPDDYDHQGRWDLVRTRSNMVNADYSEELIFKESYTFRHNGRFIKTRIENESEISAEGTYKIVKRPWQGEGEPLLSLELKFEKDSPLIANCTQEPVEHLVITPKYLLVNTWIMCDGFVMEYEKAEQADV